MRSANYLVVICCAAGALSTAGPARAFGQMPPNGLRGLLHTYVEVTVSPALISDADVTGIRDAVATTLAASGIAVVSEGDCIVLDDCAELNVDIRLLESKSRSLIAYSVQVYVPQLVKLVRDPSLEFANDIATYSVNELGLARAEGLLAGVRATAMSLARSYAVVSRSENR